MANGYLEDGVEDGRIATKSIVMEIGYEDG
jgi:hypothetical protein